jgi:hypothetical protein
MALPEMDEVKDAAFKYDKKTLARMVQMGQLSSTIATMAAMMRDRIILSEMKEPKTTVTEDVLPLNNTQMAGLAAVPVREEMFQETMTGATGGLVAMASGGNVPRYQNRGSVLSLPASIRSVLDAKIAQLGLDADYVYRAISMAPPEQQRKLLSELGALSQTTPTFEPVRAEGPVPQAAAPMREATGIENIIAKQEVARPKMARAYDEAFKGLTSTFPENYSPEALGQPADTPTSGNPLFDTLGRFGKRISDAVMYSSDREAAMDRELAKYDPDRGMTGPRTPPATRPMTREEVEAAVALTGTRRPTAPAAQAAKPAGGLGATPEAAAAAPVKTPMQRAEEMVNKELGTSEQVVTEADIINRQKRFDAAFGVNREFFKEQADALAAQREELKGDRKEAANMRLLEAGLSILGGTSPYAFENIGKGASKALAGFADDVKDIKKQQRELDRSLSDVRKAEELTKRSDSERARASYEKAVTDARNRQDKIAEAKLNLAAKFEGLDIQREGLDIERLRAMKPSDTQFLFGVATEGMTPEQRKAVAGSALGRGAPRSDFTKGELLTSWTAIEKEPATMAKYEDMGIKTFPDYERFMKSGMTPMDVEAFRFVRENPNDPRVKAVAEELKRKFGSQ